MRNFPLYLLALALFTAPAFAAKPDAKQVQSLADVGDVSCRPAVTALPGPGSIYNMPSICSCAHGATAEALKNLNLENPATPTKADQEKIAHTNEHAVWSCAQPAYGKLLASSTETECFSGINEVASAKSMNEAQKRALCTCIGKTFARASTLMKLGEVGPGKMQSFADATLQQSYSTCRAQSGLVVTPHK
jgi:hypothetical protein